MSDFDELMQLLSTPRPAGSAAERATAAALRSWLAERGVACRSHTFRAYPYFNEAIGGWMLGSRLLLTLAVARRAGWAALPLALAAVVGGPADMLGLPLVSWPGARRGESLIVELGPPDAARELILAAHYDSKTELLDHRQRAFFVRLVPVTLGLTLAAGLLGAAEGVLRRRDDRRADALRRLALLIAAPVTALSGGLGLNLALGRLARPSSGAVDNGAACAILLALAERIARGQVALRRSRVTIALFGAEEVGMQGSRAYARERFRRAPPRGVLAVNLELMGQRGGYVWWERNGNGLRSVPAGPAARDLALAAVREATGADAAPEALLISDGYALAAAGVPTVVLGTRDPQQGVGGMHRPTDSPARVGQASLAEGLAVLEAIVRRYDEGAP